MLTLRLPKNTSGYPVITISSLSAYCFFIALHTAVAAMLFPIPPFIWKIIFIHLLFLLARRNFSEGGLFKNFIYHPPLLAPRSRTSSGGLLFKNFIYHPPLSLPAPRTSSGGLLFKNFIYQSPRLA